MNGPAFATTCSDVGSPATGPYAGRRFAVAALLLLTAPATLRAADLERTETLFLPECHSIGWVRSNTQVREQGNWDGVLDEAKWGVPSPQQAVARTWNWHLTDEQWRQAVRKKGEG